jgi:hypothetical protein
MSDDVFARERLGAWSDVGAQRVISAADWQRCADPNLIDSHGEVALALDVSPDRSSASVVAAGWTTIDDVPYLDLLETRSGDPDWAVHKIVDLLERHTVRAVVVDGISAASSMVDPLRRAGVVVTVTNAARMAAACGGFYDAVIAGRLRHLGQPTLSVALAAARKRRIGDGASAWSRATSTDDISSLVAASLSLWGLVSSEIAPKPEQRTGRATFV